VLSGRAGRSVCIVGWGTAGAGRCWDGWPASFAGRGGADGRNTRPGGARPGQGGARPSGQRVLLGGAGPTTGTHDRAGRGRGRRGRARRPARAVGQGEMGPARSTGRGTVEAGGAGACCEAGLVRGRHEAVKGLRRPGVGEGRWGETGPTRAAGWGVADGRRTLRGGTERPVSGRGKAGPSQGRAGRGRPGVWGVGSQGWPVCEEQAVGRRRVGRAGKNEKMGGIYKLSAYVPWLGRGT
jgi:hypothetical protein